MVFIFGQMEKNMLEIGRKENKMGMDCTSKKMENAKLENGVKGNE